MSGHTPGPWTIGQYDEVQRAYQINAQADISHLDCMPAMAAGRDKAGAMANARLIAAAPEMLVALKEALRALDGDRAINSRGMVVYAIAKAEPKS